MQATKEQIIWLKFAIKYLQIFSKQQIFGVLMTLQSTFHWLFDVLTVLGKSMIKVSWHLYWEHILSEAATEVTGKYSEQTKQL